MKNLVTTLLLFGIIYSFSQEVKKRQITSSQIDAIFSKWDTQDKPGIAVGVLNDGEIVYTKGFGLANLEHQIPVSPKTKFHIGDIAKEFTVYALLLLEQKGQLSLKDDIRKYMPELPLSHAVSIEQLIHHTGGLNNTEVSKILAGWKPEDILTKEQAYTFIKNQAKYLPKGGSIQLPSDAGFMILEDLIAQIGKIPYEDFVVKEIFNPLGMTNSLFDTNGTVIPNKANGYFPHEDSFVASTMNHKQTLLSDVYTTIEDMCLWAKELGNPKIGTKQILQKFDALSLVNNKKVNESNTALYTGGHRFWDFRGSKKLYHIEVSGGYASKLIRYPDYDLSLIVMGNDGVYNGSWATAATELYIEDFLDPITNQSTKIKSKKISKKQLSAYAGDYWDATNYSTRKIHMVNDTLRYFRAPGNESALVSLTKNSFKMITWGDVNVNFDATTTPKKMNVTVGDETFHLLEFNKNADWTKKLQVFIGNYYAEALDTNYSLILENEKLIITHPRLEPIELNPKIPDVFSGNKRHFSSLSFKRNSTGNIIGFKLSTSGIRDIWFKKEAISNLNLAGTK